MYSSGIGINSILRIPNIVQYCNAKHYNGYNTVMPLEDEVVGTTDKRWKNLVTGKPDLDMYRRDMSSDFNGTTTNNFNTTTEPTFKRTGVYPNVFFNSANRNFMTWAGNKDSILTSQNEFTWVIVSTSIALAYNAIAPAANTAFGFDSTTSTRIRTFLGGASPEFDGRTKYGFSYWIYKWRPLTFDYWVGNSFSGNFTNAAYNRVTHTANNLIQTSSNPTGNRVPQYGTYWVAGSGNLYNIAGNSQLYMVMMFERFLTPEEDFKVISHIRNEFEY